MARAVGFDLCLARSSGAPPRARAAGASLLAGRSLLALLAVDASVAGAAPMSSKTKGDGHPRENMGCESWGVKPVVCLLGYVCWGVFAVVCLLWCVCWGVKSGVCHMVRMG